MTTNTLASIRFSTIKGTARNKDRRRVWIESSKLAQFGFARHTRINVHYSPSGIAVIATPDGSRKVAGRTRNGREISILDLCHSESQHLEMFGNAAKLDVFIRDGVITIHPAK